MLGRLFNARLKAAETALADGRLDEAFRLATAGDLARERRAQKVLSEAGEKLFARAEAHYKAGRCAEALLDLDKAERAGYKPNSIGDLRTIVRAAVDEQNRNQQSRRGRIDAAQQRLAAGSLRAAEQILERASAGDAHAGKLKQQAADREVRADPRQQVHFLKGPIESALGERLVHGIDHLLYQYPLPLRNLLVL